MTAFVTKKIRARLNDPKIADKLIPTNHGYGTRRVPLESGYFEVYNQPNVKLVDIRETPIERITETGLRISGVDYEFDMIIYATGFDAITGAFDRIDFQGTRRREAARQVGRRAAHLSRPQRRGLPQHADPGRPAQCGDLLQPAALHRAERRVRDRPSGLHARQGPDAASRRRRRPRTAWTAHVYDTASRLLLTKVDSWMTGVNKNVPGRLKRTFMAYAGGAPKYRQKCEEIAANGYEGFALR